MSVRVILATHSPATMEARDTRTGSVQRPRQGFV